MSLLQVNFYSQSLVKGTTFHMILPNDCSASMIETNPHYKRNMKTLYLLHGFSGTSTDWLTGSGVQEMAQKYNLAIVMPSGDNSFYLDGKGTGTAYGRFAGEELVEYVAKTFGLSKKREDVFMGGLSMGGFGAIHTGLKYNDSFSKVFGLSSAFIIHNIKNKMPGFDNGVANYDYYVATFGNLDHLEDSENNPEYLIRQLKKSDDQIPLIYMACGTEDFIIEENRSFHRFLLNEKIDVTYIESCGVHDWKFWNEYLEPAISWLLNE